MDLATAYQLAKLAQLELSPAEAEICRDKLTTILDWVSQLNTVKTDNIEPMTHAISDHTLPLREDEVHESVDFARAQALPSLKTSTDGLYLVPKVIESA